MVSIFFSFLNLKNFPGLKTGKVRIFYVITVIFHKFLIFKETLILNKINAFLKSLF